MIYCPALYSFRTLGVTRNHVNISKKLPRRALFRKNISHPSFPLLSRIRRLPHTTHPLTKPATTTSENPPSRGRLSKPTRRGRLCGRLAKETRRLLLLRLLLLLCVPIASEHCRNADGCQSKERWRKGMSHGG